MGNKRENAIVDVVYPVYGQFELLKQSVNNLEIATNKPYNIYLVDDNSKENGKEVYQQLNKNPKVKSIQYHKKNEGFAKTVNDGAKLGFAKYILIINTDVVLFEKALDIMLDFLEQNPEVGIVGPKLLFFPNTNDPYRPTNRVQHAGMAFDSLGQPYHIYSGWEHNHPKVNVSRSVNAITGACMLIRRDLWRSLNGFDINYGKGCLVGDSLIQTDSGIFEIEKLMGNNKVDDIDIKIHSIDGVMKSNKSFRNGISEVYKVTTKKGYNVTATPDHKILTMGDGGYSEWKEIKDLTTSDYIAINTKSGLWGKNHIEEKEAYLLGLYISEGCVDENRLNITTADDEIEEFLLNNFDFRKKANKYHFRLCDKSLLDKWKDIYGFDLKRKAPDKIIPNYLLQSNKETLINILSGIFDGDGSARKNNGKITLTSSSYRLLQQIQVLLLNFGILSSINDKYKNYHQKEINGVICNCHPSYTLELTSFSDIFYDEIGFKLSRKQNRKNNLKLTEKFIDYPNSGKILRRIKEKYNPPKSISKYLCNVNCTGYLINRFLKDEDFDGLRNTEEFKYLEEMITGNIIWLQVKNVECLETPMETFDIHVPESHAYTANGIVVHNTWEDLDLCIRAKLQKKLIYYLHNAVGYHFTNASVLAAKEEYPLTENGLYFRRKFGNILPYDDYILDYV